MTKRARHQAQLQLKPESSFEDVKSILADILAVKQFQQVRLSCEMTYMLGKMPNS